IARHIHKGERSEVPPVRSGNINQSSRCTHVELGKTVLYMARDILQDRRRRTSQLQPVQVHRCSKDRAVADIYEMASTARRSHVAAKIAASDERFSFPIVDRLNIDGRAFPYIIVLA